MIKIIILIRHGEPERDKSNPERKLTPMGQKQIKRAGERILSLVKNRKCIILTTPTVRTIQSAEIISKILKVPYQKARADLRVENINKIEKSAEGKVDITFLYLKIFKERKLPKKIPSPKTIARRFFEQLKKIKNKDIVIIVGHSGALESFALNQKVYKPSKEITKELAYGEFVVLERK